MATKCRSLEYRPARVARRRVAICEISDAELRDFRRSQRLVCQGIMDVTSSRLTRHFWILATVILLIHVQSTRLAGSQQSNQTIL